MFFALWKETRVSTVVQGMMDEELHCGMQSQEKSAIRAQHAVLLALLLALVACGRLPRNNPK